jgi:hypothetical protein
MSAKDRVRTATEATAASVRQIRPLTLPDNSTVPAGQREHRSRGTSRLGGTLQRLKETWMIPLGAAAIVAALALTLVTVRHAETPPPASTNAGTVAPAVVTGIPRYFAVATSGSVSHDEMAAIDVTVTDAYTGKTVANVTLPAISEVVGDDAAVGVSATADDRSFVVGRRDLNGDTDYFLVHIAPGTKQVATVDRLPIPTAKLGAVLGLAVSPNGTQLAVLSVRGNGTTLRIYSVKSGATLRTWTAATWQYQGDGGLLGGVSWTADSRQVAFSTVTTGMYPVSEGGALEERLISDTASSGDLATASKVVLKGPDNCGSLLLTPDGGTVVCATQVNYPPPTSAAGCGKDQPMFVAYSAVTGKRLHVLYQHTGACYSGVDTVLWSDASAQHVIGETQITSQGNPPESTDRYGVAAAGQFAKFAVPLHGQWYIGPAF